VPEVVEPGTRLVERYRLDERLGGADPAGSSRPAPAVDEATTYWRAHDELLDRAVGVCLLRTGDEHAEQVLRAARKAAGLTDSRFLRVLDASKVDEVVYVVSEWVTASHLVDLLADGPLPASEARALTIEIAGALAAAHDAGLAHLCLAPEHVLRTSHGQVKLAGLGVDAAARGITEPDRESAAARDTEAAAGILYAALTARWPGDTPSRLPAAPYDGSALCSPRQVRAGVPDDLDDVASRALGVPGRHHGGPLRTPAELVAALGSTQGTARLPVPGPEPVTPRDTPIHSEGYSAPYDDQGPVRRSRPTLLAWVLVAMVLVAGLVLAGSQVMTILGDDPKDEQAGEQDTTTSKQAAAADIKPIKIAEATTLDPPPGDGDENSDRAELAVDGDDDTVWNTKTYNDQFGPNGLKTGVGLLLDLGESTNISQVRVRVHGGATGLEIRVADELGDTVEDYTLVKKAANVFPRTILRPEPVKARYVLVWLTSLPTTGGGYRGEIADVVVRG
jgi:serine/threonine protein kinase